MTRLIYDLETDGFLDAVTKVHCLVTRDYDTNEVRSYYDDTSIQHPTYAGPIVNGILAVLAADYRLGHNLIEYDERVLRKLYANFVSARPEFEKIRDTMIGARIGWPDEHLKTVDYMRKLKVGNTLPGKSFGSHSLDAWGHRLGVRKGDYGKTEGYAVFTREMLDYCIQDTNVTRVLAKRIVEKKVAPKMAWVWEQKFASRIQRQIEAGFPFDVPGALALTQELTLRRAQVADELQKLFPPYEKTITYKTKKRQIEKTKKQTIVFNPGSRVQIARLLIEKYKWKPEKFTEGGQPELSEDTLESIRGMHGVPEIMEYLMLSKRIGAISTGKEAWLKHVKPDGRIHGVVMHNAAVTSRCTHRKPNVTGVPKATKNKDGTPVAPYGYECRSLFRALPGWKLVGIDASGLELRMLANRLAPYDGGAYIQVVTTGDSKLGTDVHTRNMTAAGLPSRDDAKTFIYAFLYGAGDAKIGKIIGKGPKAGKALKARFLNNMPALKKWIEDTKLEATIKRKLKTLDGRYLHVRAAHASPNTQLQGDGAIVMKYACVLYGERLESMGLLEGRDWVQVHMAHDEFQIMAKEEHAKTVGEVGVWAIEEAGRVLRVVCPLTGEFKVGNNWAETH